jgi:hypothetical protein
VDVLDDYRAAFGEDAPRRPAQLAVMADSDNSGSSTLGWVSEIEIMSPKP